MSTDLTTTESKESIKTAKGLKGEAVVILVDHSGSMGCTMANNGLSRVACAGQAVLALIQVSDQSKTAYGLVQFDDRAEILVDISNDFFGIEEKLWIVKMIRS